MYIFLLFVLIDYKKFTSGLLVFRIEKICMKLKNLIYLIAVCIIMT